MNNVIKEIYLNCIAGLIVMFAAFSFIIILGIIALFIPLWFIKLIIIIITFYGAGCVIRWAIN